jgi:hypothetical protein
VKKFDLRAKSKGLKSEPVDRYLVSINLTRAYTFRSILSSSLSFSLPEYCKRQFSSWRSKDQKFSLYKPSSFWAHCDFCHPFLVWYFHRPDRNETPYRILHVYRRSERLLSFVKPQDRC